MSCIQRNRYRDPRQLPFITVKVPYVFRQSENFLMLLNSFGSFVHVHRSTFLAQLDDSLHTCTAQIYWYSSFELLFGPVAQTVIIQKSNLSTCVELSKFSSLYYSCFYSNGSVFKKVFWASVCNFESGNYTKITAQPGDVPGGLVCKNMLVCRKLMEQSHHYVVSYTCAFSCWWQVKMPEVEKVYWCFSREANWQRRQQLLKVVDGKNTFLVKVSKTFIGNWNIHHRLQPIHPLCCP